MFARATYFGFYPLGADVVFQGVKIMQEDWKPYRFPVVVVGKGNVVNPLFGQVYYVVNGNQTAFFVAIEDGLGKYHIFSIDDKARQKLCNKVGERYRL